MAKSGRGIDVLMANAGVTRVATTGEITDDDLDMLLTTNVKGVRIGTSTSPDWQFDPPEGDRPMTLLSIPVHDRTDAAIDAVVFDAPPRPTAQAAILDSVPVGKLLGALGAAAVSPADPFISVVAGRWPPPCITCMRCCGVPGCSKLLTSRGHEKGL